MEFINQQKMFFVASSPKDGRINLSPKGLDTFRCLDHRHVAYLDLTGAGSETASHIRENGRLTFMFCSFGEKPMIVRLYGMAQAIGRNHPDWDTYIDLFPKTPGSRMIILAEIDMVQTSCGFGVPLCDKMEERPTLSNWASKIKDDKFQKYWRQKNAVSIDGNPTGIFDNKSFTRD